MLDNHIIPEVLSPAGDAERLEAALRFGADAVYVAGEAYGMRAACANFGREALNKAVLLTHSLGKKIYVTCNILPRNTDIDQLPEYFAYLNKIGNETFTKFFNRLLHTLQIRIGFGANNNCLQTIILDPNILLK
jgi:hypothetical protein